MGKKILFIVLGVAAIILGILCLFDLDLSALLVGIGLILYGLGDLLHWNERKKAGAASVWVLITSFISIGFGVMIILGNHLGLFAGSLLLLVLSIWLMAEGVFEILGAVMYRKAMTTEDLGIQAPGSSVSMVLGVIMVAIGILGLIFPVFAMYLIQLWIALEMIISGVRLIMRARNAGFLEESDE